MSFNINTTWNSVSEVRELKLQTAEITFKVAQGHSLYWRRSIDHISSCVTTLKILSFIDEDEQAEWMRGEGVSANGQLCARLHNTNAQQNTKQMNTQAWQKLTVQQCNSNHKTIGLRACKSDAWVTTGANNAVATKTNRHLLTWRQCWLLTTTPIPKKLGLT